MEKRTPNRRLALCTTIAQREVSILHHVKTVSQPWGKVLETSLNVYPVLEAIIAVLESTLATKLSIQH